MQTESHGTYLHHIEQGAENPHHQHHAEGLFLLQRGVVEDFAVGGGFAFAQEEESAQPAAEEDKEEAQSQCRPGYGTVVHQQQSHRKGRYAVAVAEAEEIDEILPPHRRDEERNRQKDQKVCHLFWGLNDFAKIRKNSERIFKLTMNN